MSERTAPQAALVRQIVDVVALAALSLTVLLPLAPVFGGPEFWPAAIGGVAVGTAVAVLAARLRWGALMITGLIMLGYFAFGGLFALRSATILGFLPSLITLRDLALSSVFAWKQILTASTPVTGFEQLLAVPYLTGIVISALAVGFAVRLRHYQLALLPVAAGMLAAITFSDYEGFAPAWVGALASAIALGWVTYRAAAGHSALEAVEIVGERDEVSRARRRHAVLATMTLVLAAALSVGSAAVATGSWQRDVLRQQVVPPLELHDYASPLMSFRKFIEDKDTVMFTASGLASGATIRIATLDQYDGIVYKVSGAGGPGSGTFNRVGRTISGAPTGQPVDVQVTIKNLGGVWVPDVGYLSGVSVGGPRADQLQAGLHYNRATGTVVDTGGLADGDSFTFQSTTTPAPDDAALDKAKIAHITTPVPDLVPDALQDRLDEAVAGVDNPVAQVRAICTYLHDKGTFSHGVGTQAGNSRAGHTWERINTLLGNEQMVGDQEQYAVAAALMVSQLGIPVRVVMGFAPKQINPGGTTEVKGGDVTAWIEVPLEKYGWVAFNPSPPEDKEPKKQAPLPRKKPQPQVPQPPQPPQEPAQLPPEPPSEDNSQAANPNDLTWLWRALGYAGIGLGVGAVVFGPGLAMLWWKGRRRIARRNAASLPQRVSGAWADVLDTVHDVGVATSAVATRRETASTLSEAYPAVGLPLLAARADAFIFGDQDPSEEEASAYWSEIDQARRGVTSAANWKQKLRSFFWPRSVTAQIGAGIAAASRRFGPRWRRSRS